MEKFSKEIQVRWSDLDPNFHLRHSVYFDWGAFCRIDFLKEFDLTPNLMKKLHFGPVVFREECVFKREILDGDKITIDLTLLKARKDFSRWTIRHHIIKNEDVLSAVLTVDGAWIDTVERKLTIPPAPVGNVFSEMPVDGNFQWLE
jgi:acyl-CoA thioester hydrolase